MPSSEDRSAFRASSHGLTRNLFTTEASPARLAALFNLSSSIARCASQAERDQLTKQGVNISYIQLHSCRLYALSLTSLADAFSSTEDRRLDRWS